MVSSDGLVIVGDFNVDFGRQGPLHNLLVGFMSDHDLVARDLPFHGSIGHTYERDDGLSRSWIDHVMCSRSFSTLVTDVFARHSGSNLSDHSPLHFLLHVQGQSILQSPLSSSPSNSKCTKIRWSNISPRDLDNYHNLLSKNLPTFPPEVVNCSNVDCEVHYEAIDSFTQLFVSTLLSCSFQCFPCSTPSSPCKLAGWNDGRSTDATKKASCFWHKVWVEAGRPSGALFNIKREAKRRFKSSVRRLKRRQQYLVRDKLAKSFGSKKKDKFWSEVKRLKSAKNSSCSPVVDGISGGMNIANLFSSKFKNLLNKHPPSSRSDLLSQINSSLCESHLCEMDFSEDEVIDAIHQLKSSKSDADGVFTNHLKLACPVIAEPLALLFSTILRHGYMPPVLRDCVLVFPFLRVSKIPPAV